MATSRSRKKSSGNGSRKKYASRKRRRQQKQMKLFFASLCIIALIAIVVVLIIKISGSNTNDNYGTTANQPVTSNFTPSTTKAAAESKTDNSSTKPTIAPLTTAANATTAAPQGLTQAVISGGQVVGKTKKGYDIIQKDGIYYVNGIMIVNKTYPLPSTYAPGLQPEVQQAFNRLQAAATAQGLNIWLQSGFRTYDRQVTLYNNYVASDGKAAADTYSARPGYSEHQSGLCFDLNTIEDSFGYTPEGKWVAAHAHEYGFIIRFPQGKESITGYKYESWHLRYVGVEIATDMYNQGVCLEEYLGVTSVYPD